MAPCDPVAVQARHPKVAHARRRGWVGDGRSPPAAKKRRGRRTAGTTPESSNLTAGKRGGGAPPPGLLAGTGEQDDYTGRDFPLSGRLSAWANEVLVAVPLRGIGFYLDKYLDRAARRDSGKVRDVSGLGGR